MFLGGDACCAVRPSTLASRLIGEGIRNRLEPGLVLLALWWGNQPG